MFNVGSAQGYLKLNTTGWNSPMKSATASVTALSRTFTRMAAVTVGSLFLIEREFGKFDKAIRHATSVSETTEEQFSKMSDMALDASVKWNKAAAITAQAFYYLGSAGLTVTEQMQAFNDSIMLSRAMGSDLSQTVEGLVDIVRAFGLEFSNVSTITDQLTKTVISSNQNFRDLEQALSYGASTARLTNNTLAETTAMLGVMANAGIKGSMAGTVLRRAMTNLMAPTGDMAELVYALGLNIYDTSGKMRPFIHIMGQISDALKGTSDRFKNLVFETLFGRRAIAGQIVLFNYGSKALRKYADEIENATDATEKVAGKQMKAFTEVLGQLWQELRRIAIVAGGTLAPAIERMANQIRYGAKELRKYIEANSEAIATALKWVTVISAVGLAIPIIATMITSVLSLINPFTLLVGTIYLLRTVWVDTFEHGGVLNRALDEFGDTLMKFLDEKTGLLDDFIKILYRGFELPLRVPGAVWNELKEFPRIMEESARQLGMFANKPVKFEGQKEAVTAFVDVVASGKTAVAELGRMAAEQVEKDMASIEALIKKVIPDNWATEMEKVVAAIKGLFNIVMREPPTLSGLGIPALAFTKESLLMKKQLRDLIAWADVVIEKEKLLLKTPSIWAKRWSSGVGIVINDLETWWDVFSGVNKDMISAWSDTMNSFISDGGNFKDFMEDMFKGVLDSFNKMVSDVLAADLWYSMFGQGKELPFGTASIFNRGKIAKSANNVEIPGWDTFMPDYQKFQQSDPTTQLGGFPTTQKAVVPSVVINNNTGEPMSASKPTFNGKEYVVNVVMEEYNTNPNFRNALTNG